MSNLTYNENVMKVKEAKKALNEVIDFYIAEGLRDRRECDLMLDISLLGYDIIGFSNSLVKQFRREAPTKLSA